MSETKKLALLGGDLRQAAAAARLAESGFECAVWGMGERADIGGGTRCGDWRSAAAGASAVVLPLPASSDGVRIECPLASESMPRLRLSVLQAELDPAVPILGGRIPERFMSEAGGAGRRIIDYFESEELQLRNAVPTAEGALFIAMRELDVTVREARVAVTGFGRIGKEVAFLFRRMGARVTVAARKRQDLAYASVHGMETVHMTDTADRGLSALKAGVDLIVNTVPARIFDETVLRTLSRETMIIDLASVPGGVDPGEAEKRGIRAIWALSLPGRYAPVSAGRMIADTVTDILKAEGIL